MTGANPIVLSFDKLGELLITIRQYLPEVKQSEDFPGLPTFPKSIEEPKELHVLGLGGISIGTETGDYDVYDDYLKFLFKPGIQI